MVLDNIGGGMTEKDYWDYLWLLLITIAVIFLLYRDNGDVLKKTSDTVPVIIAGNVTGGTSVDVYGITKLGPNRETAMYQNATNDYEIKDGMLSPLPKEKNLNCVCRCKEGY